MRIYGCQIIIACLGLFVLFTGQRIHAQQEKPITLNDILLKLTFTSRVSKSTEEINERLIDDVRKRKVNFILDLEGERSLRKVGGNDSLIKVIHENLPEEVKKKIIRLEDRKRLYLKFLGTYNGKTVEEIKAAVEAAKEYVKKYSDSEDSEDKEIIDYFRATIPYLESQIEIQEKRNKKFPIIN